MSNQELKQLKIFLEAFICKLTLRYTRYNGKDCFSAKISSNDTNCTLEAMGETIEKALENLNKQVISHATKHSHSKEGVKLSSVKNIQT